MKSGIKTALCILCTISLISGCSFFNSGSEESEETTKKKKTTTEAKTVSEEVITKARTTETETATEKEAEYPEPVFTDIEEQNTAAPETSAEQTVISSGYTLPDFGASIYTVGEWDSSEEIEGITYDAYHYEFEKAESSHLSQVVTYYSLLVKKAGFELEPIEEMSDDCTTTVGDKWYTVTCDDGIAFLCLTGSYFSKKCEAYLGVPRTINFEQYTGSQSDNSFLNETYSDRFTDEYIEIDGDPHARIVCVSCHGSGKCVNCGGTGRWKNPYTGEWNDCTCNNGVCPICDGLGYY